MIFEFLKKIFGWAGESREQPRKRSRAVSFSFEKEYVTPKKRCCNYETINVDDEVVEMKDDSEDNDDDLQIIDKYSPVNSFNRMQSNMKDKSHACCSSAPSPKPQWCCDKDITYYDKSKDSRNRQHCSTLSEANSIKERNQYKELLQKFLPHRIHVIYDKDEDKKSEEPIEVIDLEKSPPISQKYDRTYRRHCSAVRERREKKLVITLDNDEEETVQPVYEKLTPKRSTNVKKPIERVATNTLRDQFAAKAVVKEDFIPQTTKQYNERLKQRHKEVEELKRMTCLLANYNRLAREAALEEHLARSMRICEAVLEEIEEPEEPDLPILTEDMVQKVRNALIPRPPDEVLVEGFGLRITRKDIHTLDDLNWLNDEVINFYMNLLIVRGGNDKYPKVHAMNTFFYPKLVSGGHSSLKRWTRRIDIFSKDLVVVPVHLGIHWCMSIIDFRDKSIRYYDSMGGNNQNCLSSLRKYLEDESLDKKKQTYDTSDWKLICVKNIPMQMNGSDCGVFSCVFAEYICANKKITFTQQDMPYFRNKMVYEILKSKLL